MDKRTKILMPQSVGHSSGGKGHGPKGKEPDDLEFRAQCTEEGWKSHKLHFWGR
jgi:hypothetical protein